MWGQEFIELFTQSYYIISMVCLFIGLILCAIECFIPGFGVFGITGIIFCVFSVVFLLCNEGSFQQFIYVVGIAMVVMTTVILIAIRSARFGALSRSSLVQKGTALPEDFSSNEKNYSYLMGKIGKTETICKPVGKAIIDGCSYQVITKGELIEKSAEILVSEVDGATIVVKKN